MRNLRLSTDMTGKITAVHADCSRDECIIRRTMDRTAVSEEEAGQTHWLKCPSCGCIAYIRLQADLRGIKKAEDYGVLAPLSNTDLP